MAMIEFDGLSKSYGDVTALEPMTLNIESGELFGFLGPNGAGKTTTIRMMMGILVPTHGEVRINGLDCHSADVQVKRMIGYLPDQPVFYDYMRGREILQFVGEMHGLSRAECGRRVSRLFEEFDLSEVEDEYAVNYSLGTRKKLALACALIHEPSVLILDEPVNGLDPRATRDVCAGLQRRVAHGVTVFMSTHLLDMAERLCTRVAILDRGELTAIGTLDYIRAQTKNRGSLEDIFLQLTDDAYQPNHALDKAL